MRKKNIFCTEKQNTSTSSQKFIRFLNRSYFCENCMCGHNDKKKHKCHKSSCNLCFSTDCYYEKSRPCEECNMVCNSDKCYDAHKKKGYDVTKKKETPSTCESFHKCLVCGRNLKESEDPRATHNCELTYCKNCKIFVSEEAHHCFQQPTKPTPPSSKYIFFDLKCNQETGTHVVNYVVAQKTCDRCIDQVLNDDNLVCTSCREHQKQFSTAEKFRN